MRSPAARGQHREAEYANPHRISPSTQLGFPRPLTQVVKKTLTVTNSNAQPVAFKVKTTAPKQYCVRPNSGRIEAGDRVEVQVMLQPLKEEPPASAKCRDKFLVQSAVITPEMETLPITELWAILELENKQAVSEHKIRCVFQPPSSATVPEEGETYNPLAAANQTQGGAFDKSKAAALAAGGATAAGAGAAYSSVKDHGTRAFGGAPAQGATRSGEAEPPVSIASINNLQSSGASPAVGSASSASSPQDLQLEVQRLRAELAAAREKGSAGGATSTASATSSGVPVHIVAAIAVAVFAVTYLFF